MPKQYEEVREWFELEDDPMGGEIEIVHLEGPDIEAIIDRSTVTRTTVKAVAGGDPENPKIEQEREQRVYPLKDREETAVAAVKAWKNFYGRDGKPMECTEENKRYWARDNWFMGHLRSKRKILADRVTKERAEAAKNLNALPSGAQG